MVLSSDSTATNRSSRSSITHSAAPMRTSSRAAVKVSLSNSSSFLPLRIRVEFIHLAKTASGQKGMHLKCITSISWCEKGGLIFLNLIERFQKRMALVMRVRAGEAVYGDFCRMSNPTALSCILDIIHVTRSNANRCLRKLENSYQFGFGVSMC